MPDFPSNFPSDLSVILSRGGQAIMESRRRDPERAGARGERAAPSNRRA